MVDDIKDAQLKKIYLIAIVWTIKCFLFIIINLVLSLFFGVLILSPSFERTERRCLFNLLGTVTSLACFLARLSSSVDSLIACSNLPTKCC